MKLILFLITLNSTSAFAINREQVYDFYLNKPLYSNQSYYSCHLTDINESQTNFIVISTCKDEYPNGSVEVCVIKEIVKKRNHEVIPRYINEKCSGGSF